MTARTGVAIVAGPAGYGKTVLLSAWAHAREDATAWLALTPHDDELRVLHGILAALELLSDAVSDAVSDAGSGDAAPGTLIEFEPSLGARDTIAHIVTVVAGFLRPVVIVIDDAHHAGALLGARVIDPLIALTRGRLQFVVAGRPEILGWHAKLAAAHPHAVLMPHELALTLEELTADAAARGLTLHPDVAAERWSATGGWPLALHLHEFAARGGHGDAMLQERLLVDFVAAHVLPPLSSSLREFVLAATTVDRLDPGIAAALSGRDDAEALLEECVRSGLFLVPGDARSNTTYRWHPVFARACRKIVSRASVSKTRNLNAIAARELASDCPTEALAHAVLAGDAELTHSLIQSTWIRVIIDSGAGPLLMSCLSLPEASAQDPEVLLIRAACLNLLGDRSGARLLFENALTLGGSDAGFESTRAFAALFVLDHPVQLARAADDAAHCLSLGVGSQATYAYRFFLLGWTRLRLRRDFTEASRLLRTAWDEARLWRRETLRHRAGSNLLFALTYAGRFAEAERLLDDELVANAADGEWGHYDGGIGLFALGVAAFWQGRFDEASDAFNALVATGGHPESYSALGRVYLTFMAAIRGNPRELYDARAHLDGIGHADTHGVPWPAYRGLVHATLLLADGDRERTLAVVRQFRTTANVPTLRVVGAELARRAGDSALAMELLAQLSIDERAVSYVAVAAETTAALVAHAHGDSQRAHRHIGRALDAATSEGVILPFISSEPALHALLADHAVAGSPHAVFIAARLAEHETSAGGDAVGAGLSSREREVLGYLRTALTAGEIAAALFVSVNTVRTHQRSIYRKLGVGTRRAAVQTRR